MNSMPMPRLARCSASTARISACVVTSSAVVGSSQMSRRGELVSAPAIMTRCSMPPDSSCGYWRRCSSGRGIRTAASSDEATALASAAERFSHSRIVSVRWSPTVRIGLMPARGSWKIIDALVRRRSSSSLRLASSTDRPSRCTEPPVAGAGRKQPEHRASGERLARARLAHEPDRLALGDREADAVEQPRAVGQVERQLGDVEECHAGIPPPMRSESSSPITFTATTTITTAIAGTIAGRK